MSRRKKRRIKKPRTFGAIVLASAVAEGRDLAVPDCPVQRDCGGCTWQRLAYDRQLAAKREHVLQCFAAVGLAEVPLETVLPSPRVYGYRNMMELSFSARRWLTGAEIARGEAMDRDFALGLHAPGGFGRVIDLETCSLQDARADATMRAVKRFARSSGLAPWNHRTHEGFWRFLRLRRGDATGQRLVGVVTASRDEGVMTDLRDALARTGLLPDVLANGVTDRVADTSEGAAWFVDHGPDAFIERLDGLAFSVSAASFFQPNSGTAGIIFGLATEMAALTGRERVLDLFCGAGTLSAFLARRAGEVLGLELSAGSIADARANAIRNGIANARFEVADLLRGLPEGAGAFDVVVSDPPRSGMHPKLVDELKRMAPPRIVSVGCNPKTQAIDLAALCADGAYRITRMLAVDQFPHTPHVENLAVLERGAPRDVASRYEAVEEALRRRESADRGRHGLSPAFDVRGRGES